MAGSENNKKLFVVEDDLDLAEMLRAYFASQGYDISTVAEGKKAIRLIKEEMPDVVILDIRLPDIDGYEVCRRLRHSRQTQHLPIIFLTERRRREDKLAGLELGAVDYITKPFDIMELRLRIRNALRRAELRTLHNPITGLPEGPLVQERLETLVEEKGWGLVIASIEGLNKFRDEYGFVAADDVTRAVSLMLTNAMQEDGAEEDFIGHTDASVFVIITGAERCEQLAERCRVRLEPSVQYFYPALDRPRIDELGESERLSVKVATLTFEDGEFSSLEDVGKALNQLFP